MPQIAQYLQAPFDFTDNTLPVFNPNDPWIDNGTEFLFDGGRLKSWPSQAAPANGATIVNLVEGKPNAEVVKTASNIGFRENGFDFLGVGSNQIFTGAVDDFRLPTMGNPDFLAIVWVKRETGFSTGNFQNILGRNAANTVPDVNEWRITTGSAGVGSAQNVIGNSPAQSYGLAISDALIAPLLNTTMQLGVSVEGTVLTVFLNGQPRGTSAFLKPYNTVSGQRLISGNGIGGSPLKAILKRWGFTKLNQGKTAAQRVLEDWNANQARLNTI